MAEFVEIAHGITAPCFGTPESKNYLFFINRLNSDESSDCIQSLISDLQSAGYFIIMFNAACITDHWRHNATENHTLPIELPADIIEQVMAIKYWLDNLADKNVVILSQSRGGIVAALLDGCPQLTATFCFGYPFKNQQMGHVSYRIEALLSTTKPYFIFQGTRDEYGGADVLEKYILPSNIKIHLFESDHGFSAIEPNEISRLKHQAFSILKIEI